MTYNENCTVGSGVAAGCTLPVTSPMGGMWSYVNVFLVGLMVISVGLYLYNIPRVGTKLPILSRWFPTEASNSPMSPSSTGKHGNWAAKHRV